MPWIPIFSCTSASCELPGRVQGKYKGWWLRCESASESAIEGCQNALSCCYPCWEFCFPKVIEVSVCGLFVFIILLLFVVCLLKFLWVLLVYLSICLFRFVLCVLWLLFYFIYLFICFIYWFIYLGLCGCYVFFLIYLSFAYLFVVFIHLFIYSVTS